MPRHSTLLVCLLAVAVCGWLTMDALTGQATSRTLRKTSPFRNLPAEAFDFKAPRPQWLAPPDAGAAPLLLRIAVMSHPAERTRRAAIRETVLADVPPADVVFEHKFFTGRVPGQRTHGWSSELVDNAVDEEQSAYGDVAVLDLNDGPSALGIKRHAALLWAAQANSSTYDFFMTFDDDTFVRLAALSRRAKHMGIGPSDAPKRPILWANTKSSTPHWSTNATSNHTSDEHVGISYPYPLGFAYLLSSNLTTDLVSQELPMQASLQHDAELVGAWVHAHMPATDVVHDAAAFHTAPIDWNTVVVRASEPVEMRGLRRRVEFANEFTRALADAQWP